MYSFLRQVAYDESTGTLARDAVFEVFDPADTSFSAPLVVVTDDGRLVTTLSTGELAILPGFRHSSLDVVTVRDITGQWVWDVQAVAAAAQIKDELSATYLNKAEGLTTAEGDDRYALKEDTKWRDITDELSNGWTATYVKIRRESNQVFIESEGLDPAAATSDNFYVMLPGFQTSSSRIACYLGGRNTYVQSNNSGDLGTPRDGFTVGLYYHEEVSFHTDDIWPPTLPGTPA